MYLLPPPETGPHTGERPKARTGRMGVPYKYSDIENLGGIMATNSDIAGWYRVRLRTVERWRAKDKKFNEAYECGLAKGRISLRMKQRQLAMDGDRVMLIWLGKQLLGQSDTVPTPAEDPQRAQKTIEIYQIDALITAARIGE